jgi:threonine/homoserine/homoserine lactone efflux protein
MALAVAAGLGLVLTALPGIELVMKLVGSAYLLYLAYRIARSRDLERGRVARPLGVLQAAAFQAINPKAWIFALGAITTFRPADLSMVWGSTLVATTMMVVIVPAAALWAGAGGLLATFVEGERAHRIVSVGLAALLAATVAYVWA